MAGPGPGRAWRPLALCSAAVLLAAAAAGGALVAWSLAAARGPHCPGPGLNATAPPRDPAPGADELRRRLAEAARRRDALEAALGACEGRQTRLQTQLTALKSELEEAKAQEAQLGVENRALTEALARWEAAAPEAARRLDEALQRAGAAEAEGDACAAREAALRERVAALEARWGPRHRGSRPRPRSRPRPGPTKGCRRGRGAPARRTPDPEEAPHLPRTTTQPRLSDPTVLSSQEGKLRPAGRTEREGQTGPY